MNFFMELPPSQPYLLMDERCCGCRRRDLKRFTHHVTFIDRNRAGEAQGQGQG
jgi:hypothetical protein